MIQQLIYIYIFIYLFFIIQIYNLYLYSFIIFVFHFLRVFPFHSFSFFVSNKCNINSFFFSSLRNFDVNLLHALAVLFVREIENEKTGKGRTSVPAFQPNYITRDGIDRITPITTIIIKIIRL